ncbi:hypothetical protein HanXRQr2_Chr04g0174151 [Helianthus annuus]|uniref:Uncharacterized protein n=1 Tax=Helianthus annuus TaxID=4232 RepID=A0A9K3J960_HELAN|nr:hypothetical protein HanXRQr2_Chr04g0174151 [Helianthus annuus]KAJ0931941.1 hypothetical protein HanPSC8_Chr04g0167801 [Helianthus annuus]
MYNTQNQTCNPVIICLYNNHTSTASYNTAHIKRTFGFGLRLRVGNFWLIFIYIFFSWRTNKRPTHDNFICKTHNIFGLVSTQDMNNIHNTFFFFLLFPFSIFFFLFFFLFFFFQNSSFTVGIKQFILGGQTKGK